MRTITLPALCALAVGAAAPASAVTVNLDSITAQWKNPIFSSGTPNASVDGNEVSWGLPFEDGPLSSYVFDPRQDLGVVPENPFLLGTFTHNNFPILLPAIDSVDLELTVIGSIDGVAFEIDPVFGFDHIETPNEAVPCGQGGPNPCADLVTLENQQDLSEVVTVNGEEFTIVVEGFVDTLTEQPALSYLTTEGQANSAFLRARIDAPLAPPPPAPIPLPAAGFMVLAGLGGLAALRSARRA